MRRDGSSLRWIATDPFFVLHFLNAYDENETIVIDFVRHETFGAFGRGTLCRAAIGAGGAVQFSTLEDRKAEFPRVDPQTAGRRVGIRTRPPSPGRERCGVISASDLRAVSEILRP